MRIFTRFRREEKGQAAILFGLLLLPSLAAVGAGLDYARAANVRTALQNAVDAAALAAARDMAGASPTAIAERAQQMFAANYGRRDATLGGVDVVKSDRAIRISARADVKTSIMHVFRMDTMPVAASGEVAWGRKKIELALVLDNTGSMAWSGKLPALKEAVRDLLRVLEEAAHEKDAVKISIVPFNTQVNVGPAHRDAAWLTYDAGLPQNLQATRANWQGCIVDRDQPHDVRDGGSAPYPAARCEAPVARMQPLTNDFRVLRAAVDAMTAEGFTNITLGAAWGLASLSPGAPLTDGQAFGGGQVEKIMILLTDGDNTRNRFTSRVGEIDARTRAMCQSIKDVGVKLHTIRVIEGNRTLLRGCATSPDLYYEVDNANQLGPVFRRIAAEISGIRLTH